MIQRSDAAEMRKYQPEGTTLFLSTNSAEEPIFSRAINWAEAESVALARRVFPIWEIARQCKA